MFWHATRHAGPQFDVYVYDSAYCYERVAFWSSIGWSARDKKRIGFDGVCEALRNRAAGYAAILEHKCRENTDD